MNRLHFFTAILLAFCLSLAAAAAPKGRNAALLTVTTYDQNGKELGQGTGFFISEKGLALATYAPFSGAYSAKVTDAGGKTWQVTRICGANEIYDVVKFQTDCPAASYLELADTPLAPGAQATVTDATGKVSTAKVTEAKTYEGIAYYTLGTAQNDALNGLPLLDAKGKVAGIMQVSADQDKTRCYAVGIALEKNLQINALSAGVLSLNNIHIPKQLPADQQQAQSYLYLIAKNTTDTITYLAGLTDFIAAYPELVSGYSDRAAYYAFSQRFAQAEADYELALQQVPNKAEVYYFMSKLIYQLARSKSYKPYKDWTLERALSEAQKAQQADPNALYQLQEGDCHFAMKQYEQAYNKYQEINRTEAASAQTFYYAARARELFDDDSTHVLALLDSAMTRFSQPYRSDAAPYLLERANHRAKYGFHRAAAIDLNEYENIVGTDRLSAQFFYEKEQIDVKARLYPWALDDIDKALRKAPKDYLLLVEKAIVNLHVGNLDEAIYNAEQALKVESDGSDAYKALGIAYGEKGDKAKAREYLKKAKQLGDEQVDEWLDKL